MVRIFQKALDLHLPKRRVVDLTQRQVIEYNQVMRSLKATTMKMGARQVSVVPVDALPKESTKRFSLQIGETIIDIDLSDELYKQLVDREIRDFATSLQAELAFDPFLMKLEDLLKLPVVITPRPVRSGFGLLRRFEVALGDVVGGLWVRFDPGTMPLVNRVLDVWPEPRRKARYIPVVPKVMLGRFVIDRSRLATLRRGEAFLPKPDALSVTNARLGVASQPIAMVSIEEDRVDVLTIDQPSPSHDAASQHIDEVELSFEVDCLPVDYKDFSALSEGAAVPLPLPISDAPVKIVANDTVVAVGQLISIEGHTCVQVREVRAGMAFFKVDTQADVATLKEEGQQLAEASDFIGPPDPGTHQKTHPEQIQSQQDALPEQDCQAQEAEAD